MVFLKLHVVACLSLLNSLHIAILALSQFIPCSRNHRNFELWTWRECMQDDADVHRDARTQLSSASLRPEHLPSIDYGRQTRLGSQMTDFQPCVTVSGWSSCIFEEELSREDHRGVIILRCIALGSWHQYHQVLTAFDSRQTSEDERRPGESLLHGSFSQSRATYNT